jgi:hypothetical protein
MKAGEGRWMIGAFIAVPCSQAGMLCPGEPTLDDPAAAAQGGNRTFGPGPSPPRWYTRESLAIRIPFRWRYP